MVLEPFHPKFIENRKKLENKIKLAIEHAVDEFENEVGIYCTDIVATYHKDQKILRTDIKPIFKVELEKGAL